MTRFKRTSVVALSLAAIAACSSSSKDNRGSVDPNDPSRGDAPLTADEKICDEHYKAQVSFAKRCGGILIDSPAAIARFRLLCSRELAAPGADALRDARIKCGKARLTAPCDEIVPECMLPPGSLANGAACAVRAQCQSRYCKVDDGGCGVCAPLVAAGGVCTAASDCAYGDGEVASCNFAQGSNQGVCATYKLAQAGQTCGETFCDVGLHCEGATQDATSGTCAKNVDAGGACSSNRYCTPGLVCSSGKCAAKPKEGEACAAVDDCADGLACDGKCKTFSYVDVDSQCDATHRCARGRCVQPTNPGANGQTQAAGPASCVAPLEDGESCGDGQTRPCDFFARCIGGQCVLADPAHCKKK